MIVVDDEDIKFGFLDEEMIVFISEITAANHPSYHS